MGLDEIHLDGDGLVGDLDSSPEDLKDEIAYQQAMRNREYISPSDLDPVLRDRQSLRDFYRGLAVIR